MNHVPNPDDAGTLEPEVSQVDRSMLTPSIVRFLLGRYGRCVQPRYNIVEADVLKDDGMNLRKRPDSEKFQVLMMCAIAAACQSYKFPTWKPFAQTCRSWANELTSPIISPADCGSLSAILLLLLYELADPSRGILWDLHDLAIRISLQLGWHRSAPSSTQTQRAEAETKSNEVDFCPNSIEFRLMSVLRDIEG